MLGIPFSDIMRVLCSILLLGNVRFVEGTGLELDVQGNNGEKTIMTDFVGTGGRSASKQRISCTCCAQQKKGSDALLIRRPESSHLNPGSTTRFLRPTLGIDAARTCAQMFFPA